MASREGMLMGGCSSEVITCALILEGSALNAAFFLASSAVSEYVKEIFAAEAAAR
jgi:hypothetical protein